MRILTGITSLFRRRSRMSAVSVYRRNGQYFIVTQHASDGGDPSIVSGPVEVVPVDAAGEALGAAVVLGLDRTTHNHPRPAGKEDWKQVIAPLLAAARCRSWPAFARAASAVRVDRMDGHFRIGPTEPGPKQGFYPVHERDRDLTDPSTKELGDLVAAELAFAADRDDVGPAAGR